MRKLTYFMIAMFAIFVFLSIESCNNNNEEPSVDGPVVNVPTGTTVMVGKTVSLSFQINAPGKIGKVTVSASEGDAVLVDPTPIIGQTSGIASVAYTAPLDDGTKTVTLIVEDKQSTPKSTTVNAEVSVTLAPESTSELLVSKFSSAPVMDGEIDEMWNMAQKLVGKAVVPAGLGPRNTYYNEPDIGEEDLDIFEAYEGEEYPFVMRAGYVGGDIYFLIEWEDDEDSKDRMSWYFDPATSKWKQEHKYADFANDKYYEDKFAFLFPIGTVDNFESSTCYATCHSTGGVITNPKDKHTRHYLTGQGQKVDMWHWKRVRGTYADQVDDQRITYEDPPYNSSTNGRSGDENGGSGYSDNKQTLNNGVEEVSVPLYIIPGQTNYYWISQDQIDDATAKMVTAVDANGVLTLDDDSTIDPAGDAGFVAGSGDKRVPSVTTRAFTGARADIDIKYTHTGTGWICEVKRSLDTNDDDDVIFDPAEDYPFGFAIFNNAAIAHAIKPNLLMKFEQ